MALQWIIQKVHYEEKHTKEKEKENNMKNESSPVPKIYLWTLPGWLSFQEIFFYVNHLSSIHIKQKQEKMHGKMKLVEWAILYTFLLPEKIQWRPAIKFHWLKQKFKLTVSGPQHSISWGSLNIVHDATAGKKLKIKLTHLSRCCEKDTGGKALGNKLFTHQTFVKQASVSCHFLEGVLLFFLAFTWIPSQLLHNLCTYDITDIANLAFCLVSLHPTDPTPLPYYLIFIFTLFNLFLFNF